MERGVYSVKSPNCNSGKFLSGEAKRGLTGRRVPRKLRLAEGLSGATGVAPLFAERL
jgi:hypothetical protein